MKITAIEIKPGMIIEHKNDYWNVLKTQHVKPGKGGAFNQVELKSVIKGTKLNERFRSSETVEKAEVDEKKFNFLYIDGENCHFMDSKTFEQVEIPKSVTGEQYKLLKENLEITISFMEEKPISIELPNNIECSIESTDAAIKNQTASSSYKPALLDCGIKIDVPLCMKASRSLIRDFGEIENLQVSSKGPGDFVTSADKRTEKIIIEELQKAHPDYGIITEESGIINKANKNNRWIIDPIDGTTNFLNGIPQFAISIGYEEENEIKCGVIFDPIKNEMFLAEKGNGAYLNNSRIRVSNKKKLKDALLVTGGPRQTSKMKEEIFSEFIKVSNNILTPVRKFGSAALDIAYVACGRFDGYWQRELNYWDIAAGIIILKEAGGFIDFFEPDNEVPLKRNILASNANIHNELSDLIIKKNIE